MVFTSPSKLQVRSTTELCFSTFFSSCPIRQFESFALVRIPPNVPKSVPTKEPIYIIDIDGNGYEGNTFAYDTNKKAFVDEYYGKISRSSINDESLSTYYEYSRICGKTPDEQNSNINVDNINANQEERRDYFNNMYYFENRDFLMNLGYEKKEKDPSKIIIQFNHTGTYLFDEINLAFSALDF